jgi:hypothetical protein
MEPEPPRDDEQEPIDVVLTVGDLDGTVVALREFLHRSGAVEVQAVLDRPGAAPALITCGRLQPIEVTEGERTVHLPHAVELDPEPPALEQIPALPPLEVDAGEGVITGPLGGVEAMARVTTQLAEHLGGRSVALAFFATTDPETPLGVGARPGEQPVITLGEAQFTLP